MNACPLYIYFQMGTMSCTSLWNGVRKVFIACMTQCCILPGCLLFMAWMSCHAGWCRSTRTFRTSSLAWAYTTSSCSGVMYRTPRFDMASNAVRMGQLAAVTVSDMLAISPCTMPRGFPLNIKSMLCQRWWSAVPSAGQQASRLAQNKLTSF